jgi:hypothetical protein
MTRAKALSPLFMLVVSGCLFPVEIGGLGRDGQSLAGDPCDVDGACAEDLSCIEGICTFTGEGSCANDDGCAAGSSCNAGVCDRNTCGEGGDCGAAAFCDRDGLCTPVDGDIAPAIVISETGFGLGEIPIGSASIGDVEIDNFGTAPLHITRVSLEGDSEPFFLSVDVTDNGDGTATVNSAATVLENPLTIEPDQRGLVWVIFQPTVAGDFLADVVVESDDPENPLLRVGIRGIGGGDGR